MLFVLADRVSCYRVSVRLQNRLDDLSIFVGGPPVSFKHLGDFAVLSGIRRSITRNAIQFTMFDVLPISKFARPTQPIKALASHMGHPPIIRIDRDLLIANFKSPIAAWMVS